MNDNKNQQHRWATYACPPEARLSLGSEEAAEYLAKEGGVLNTPAKASQYLWRLLRERQEETLIGIVFDGDGKVLQTAVLSTADEESKDAIAIDSGRSMLRLGEAIGRAGEEAKGVLLAHNHPWHGHEGILPDAIATAAGDDAEKLAQATNSLPSLADIELQQRMATTIAGEGLIPIDHVIIGQARGTAWSIHQGLGMGLTGDDEEANIEAGLNVVRDAHTILELIGTAASEAPEDGPSLIHLGLTLSAALAGLAPSHGQS